MSYPVQRSLWEGLESVFLANARNLLRDIAYDLNRPEKELLKAFSQDQVKLHLVDEPAADQECCALELSTGVATRCRRAVYRNTCYCPFHHRTSANQKYAFGYPTLRRVQIDSGETYFLDPVTQLLYSKDYQRVGMRTEKTVILFKIEEQTEDREETSDHVSSRNSPRKIS